MRRIVLSCVLMVAGCAAPVAYQGPMPAGLVDPQPVGGDPCPSCAFTADRSIRGSLKVSTGYGSTHFPIQWMKAIYLEDGVVQGTDELDVGDGTPDEHIDHAVGAGTFDEILLQWQDAEDVVETSDHSIPFET